MVDQRAKNMFLTYWGNTGKWYPYFYDNDTCFGINNEGGLSFDYYHEDTDQVDGANVYNGQLSTLWVNFRQAFPDKIKETYQDLRSNSVLNYDEIVDQFINKGSNKWSESVYNEDGDFKYISMLRSNNDATNLPQVRGTGEEHLRYFLENRFNYCDSKWYAGEYISKYDPITGDIVNNFVTLRIYTPVDESGNPRTDLVIPANADITITPYSHMYGGVRYKANGTLIQERLEANETYTFDAPNEVFNDTETAIYGAPQLSSLGDLAPLYLGYIDVGAATKLVELKIGDGTPGYQNNNLYHLAVGTNRLLKKIDIQNCVGFNQALVLTGCPNIEEVYATGSGITGVELPDSGYLKVLQLPSTITNLTLKNQLYIEDLTIEGLDRLKTITIENTPVDTLNILNNAVNVERVRLTDVDWHYADASILYELIDRNIGGIDENGTNTDTMWIDGKCHIETLTGNELAEIKRLYPYLDITYTTLTSQLMYMTEDGQRALYRQTILNGGNGGIEVSDNYDNLITSDILSETGAGGLPDGTSVDGSIKSITPFITVEPNTTYKFNLHEYIPDGCYSYELKLSTYTKDKTHIKTTVYALYNATSFTTQENAYFVKIMFFTGHPNPYFGLSGNLIDGITTPTKPSTAQYHFTFNGWALEPYGSANPDALLNVEVDRYVYAAFANEIRSYTVNFYSGTTLLYSTVVEYGSDATYVGNTPTNNSTGNIKDFEFYGWYPSPTNIQGDTNCYAQFHDLREIKDDWSAIATACLDGTATSKYEIGAFKPLVIGGLELPYSCTHGEAIIYNDELHILGGKERSKAHYKFDGTDWLEVSTLPYDFYCGKAIIFNSEIHIFGTDTGARNIHYKWDGSTWSQASTLPYNFTDGGVCILNNEIHILGSSYSKTSHYKYSGTEWISVSTLPYEFAAGSCVVYDNEIHILGSSVNSGITNHYKWNGAEWISVSTLPYRYYYGGAVVYNNEIHMMGNYFSTNSKLHYKFNGANWSEASTLPYDFYYGDAIIYNNNIVLVGGVSDDGRNIIYYSTEDLQWRWFGDHEIINMEVVAHHHDECSGSTWQYVEKLTYSFTYGEIFIRNNLLYLICGGKLVSWDGSTWSFVSDIPIGNVVTQQACLFNDELYLINNINQTSHFTYCKVYKYDWNEWSEVATIPDGISHYNGFMTSYNGSLHFIGGYYNNKHHIWNGTEWSESIFPFSGCPCNGTIYNNEIHIFTQSGRNHYKYDGIQWTKASDVPWGATINIAGNRKVEVHNGDIYVNTGESIYQWDGAEWHTITAPSTYNMLHSSIVSFNNELHLMGGQYSSSKHVKLSIPKFVDQGKLNAGFARAMCYILDNTLYGYINGILYEWDDDTSKFVKLYEAKTSGQYFLYNGEIHQHTYTTDATLENYRKIYKWNGNEWEYVFDYPNGSNNSAIIEYDGGLHVLGGSYVMSTKECVHHRWDGNSWTELENPPMALQGAVCRAFIYNNELHIVVGSRHCKWNGNTWIELDPPPFKGLCIYGECIGVATEYNGCIFARVETLNSTYAIYKYDGSTWTPFFEDSSMVCRGTHIINYRGKLHIMGGLTLTTPHYIYENPKATLTFVAKEVLKDKKNFNDSRKTDPDGNNQLTSCGWVMSDVRNYLNTDIFGKLSSVLKDNIRTVNKYSDKGARYSTEIEAVPDNIWLMSADEVGATEHPQALHGQGEPYPVFSDNASRIRYIQDSTEHSTYMLRSTSNAEPYCVFKVDGEHATPSLHGRVLASYANETPLIIGFCI